MKKKLTPVEEGASLVLDDALLEQLGLNGDAEVELSTNGDVLTVTPVRDAELEKRFHESADKITAKYAGLFKRLSE